MARKKRHRVRDRPSIFSYIQTSFQGGENCGGASATALTFVTLKIPLAFGYSATQYTVSVIACNNIINLTDKGYLMSPEYNNLSDFMVDNLEELSEIIRQAEAEETKHSAPAPIPSTADVVKRADPVQPSSQTAPEHAKDGTRPPVQTLHSSGLGRKRRWTPSSSSSSSRSSSDTDGRLSVSRNDRKTATTVPQYLMIQELNQNVLNETREPAQSLCQAQQDVGITDPLTDINMAITELDHSQSILNTINQCQDFLNQIPSSSSNSVPTQYDSLIGEQSPVISFIPDPFSDIDFAIAELNHTQAVLNTISQCQNLLNQIPAKPSTSNNMDLQTETRLDNNQIAQNQTSVFNAIDHAVNHLENVQRATSDRQHQQRNQQPSAQHQHYRTTSSEAFALGRDFQSKAGLNDQTTVTFGDIAKFEKVSNCKIVVFYRTNDAPTISKFATTSPRRQKTVFMFLFEKHYYGITILKSFLGSPYVCEYCYTGYTSAACHDCEGHCPDCSDPSCAERELRPEVCIDCNRTCHSASCLAKHKEPAKRPVAEKYVSNCKLIKRCKKCDMLYYIAMNGKGKKHACPKVKCKICGVTVEKDESEEHLCYIQRLPVETKHTEKLIFYDFETRPMYRKSIFIAHNARGFDRYIVLNAMLSLNLKPEALIMQGSKVVRFTDADYKHRYIDSLSFLTSRLSQNHLKYTGPYPEPEAYGVKQMSKEGKREFEAWYETVHHGTFNFEKEATSLQHFSEKVTSMKRAWTLLVAPPSLRPA
ncbi:hypothetical protein ABVT39_019352 [Epinephelus coioides]